MAYHPSVIKAFQTWFQYEGIPEFRAKYGADVDFTLIILDPCEEHDWRDPLAKPQFLNCYTNYNSSVGHGGTRENIARKLHFCLRNRMNSSLAHYNPGLVLPGDFPWDGAGEHRGFWGGVSGLHEECDWWVFCRCVDKLIELQEAFIRPRIEASDDDKHPDRTLAEKYLLTPKPTNDRSFEPHEGMGRRSEWGDAGPE